MISQISFGSTYKVKYTSSDKKSDFEKFSKFGEYPVTEGSSMILKDKFKNCDYSAERTLVVPESQDKNVEDYCKKYGIKFEKLTKEDLLNENNVRSRIENAPKGYEKVNLNVEKFEELVNSAEESNVKGCEEDYNKYYKEEMDLMLKSGDTFPTSTLFIDPNLNDDFDRYVSLYGTKSLKPDISFAQITPNHHEHCMYFALRDLGMKKVPVYVKKESIHIGKKLGLF